MVNKRGRDSGTGEFITIEEAKRRPKTTTVEVIPKPSTNKPKSPSPKPKGK